MRQWSLETVATVGGSLTGSFMLYCVLWSTGAICTFLGVTFYICWLGSKLELFDLPIVIAALYVVSMMRNLSICDALNLGLARSCQSRFKDLQTGSNEVANSLSPDPIAIAWLDSLFSTKHSAALELTSLFRRLWGGILYSLHPRSPETQSEADRREDA